VARASTGRPPRTTTAPRRSTTASAVAATASVALALFAGCGDESERAASGSPLPSAPDGVADGCSEAADAAAFPVVCPIKWPATSRPAKVRLRLYGGDSAYLLEAQSGFGARAPVFHVLFGGQRKPFPSGFEGGGRQLRLTTRRVVSPIYASPRGGRVVGTSVVERPTRRVGTTRIHGQPAGVLRAPTYPQGGIHGGHSIVMWNESGHGYLVSTHSETSRRAATRTAIQIARSTRLIHD
jgi:hypothetical protein